MKPPGLFIVGTDTGVGKTTIAAAIVAALTARGRRVGVLKPVATGAARDAEGRLRGADAEALLAARGGDADLAEVCPFLYEEPLAPPVAARRSGAPLRWPELIRRVDEALDLWSIRADLIVVEGVGGLYCPLTEETTVADLASTLDYPVLVVARRGLGTLNHTLMTIELARFRSLRIAGVILNEPEAPRSDDDGLAEETNAEELSRRLGPIPILAEVGRGELGGDEEWMRIVDWQAMARRPRMDRTLVR